MAKKKIIEGQHSKNVELMKHTYKLQQSVIFS